MEPRTLYEDFASGQSYPSSDSFYAHNSIKQYEKLYGRGAASPTSASSSGHPPPRVPSKDGHYRPPSTSHRVAARGHPSSMRAAPGVTRSISQALASQEGDFGGVASGGGGGGDGDGPIGSSRHRESGQGGGGTGTQVENAGVDDVIANAIATALASDAVERERRRDAREAERRHVGHGKEREGRREEKGKKGGDKGRENGARNVKKQDASASGRDKAHHDKKHRSKREKEKDRGDRENRREKSAAATLNVDTDLPPPHPPSSHGHPHASQPQPHQTLTHPQTQHPMRPETETDLVSPLSDSSYGRQVPSSFQNAYPTHHLNLGEHPYPSQHPRTYPEHQNGHDTHIHTLTHMPHIHTGDEGHHGAAHLRPSDLGKLALGSGPLHPGLNPNSPHNLEERVGAGGGGSRGGSHGGGNDGGGGGHGSASGLRGEEVDRREQSRSATPTPLSPFPHSYAQYAGPEYAYGQGPGQAPAYIRDGGQGQTQGQRHRREPAQMAASVSNLSNGGGEGGHHGVMVGDLESSDSFGSYDSLGFGRGPRGHVEYRDEGEQEGGGGEERGGGHSEEGSTEGSGRADFDEVRTRRRVGGAHPHPHPQSAHGMDTPSAHNGYTIANGSSANGYSTQNGNVAGQGTPKPNRLSHLQQLPPARGSMASFYVDEPVPQMHGQGLALGQQVKALQGSPLTQSQQQEQERGAGKPSPLGQSLPESQPQPQQQSGAVAAGRGSGRTPLRRPTLPEYDQLYPQVSAGGSGSAGDLPSLGTGKHDGTYFGGGFGLVEAGTGVVESPVSDGVGFEEGRGLGGGGYEAGGGYGDVGKGGEAGEYLMGEEEEEEGRGGNAPDTQDPATPYTPNQGTPYTPNAGTPYTPNAGTPYTPNETPNPYLHKATDANWQAARLSALMKVPNEVLVHLLVRAEEEGAAYRARLEAGLGEGQKEKALVRAEAGMELVKATTKIASLKSRLKSKDGEHAHRVKDLEKRHATVLAARLADSERRFTALQLNAEASLRGAAEKYEVRLRAVEDAKHRQSLVLSGKVLELQGAAKKLDARVNEMRLAAEFKDAELERAREVVGKMEEEREGLMREVVRSRGQVRRVREDAVVRVALEEGRREGFEEGVRKGRVVVALQGGGVLAPGNVRGLGMGVGFGGGMGGEAEGGAYITEEDEGGASRKNTREKEKSKGRSGKGKGKEKGKERVDEEHVDEETALGLLEIEKREKERLLARLRDLEGLVERERSEIESLKSRNERGLMEERKRSEEERRRNEEVLKEAKRREEEAVREAKRKDEEMTKELRRKEEHAKRREEERVREVERREEERVRAAKDEVRRHEEEKLRLAKEAAEENEKKVRERDARLEEAERNRAEGEKRLKEKYEQLVREKEDRLREVEREKRSEMGSAIVRMRELEEEVRRKDELSEMERRKDIVRLVREEDERERKRIRRIEKEERERIRKEEEEHREHERKRRDEEERERKEKEDRERAPKLPYLPMPAPPPPSMSMPVPQVNSSNYGHGMNTGYPTAGYGVPRAPSSAASRHYRRRDSGSETSEMMGFDILTFPNPSVPGQPTFPNPSIPGYGDVDMGRAFENAGQPPVGSRGLTTIHEDGSSAASRTPSPYATGAVQGGKPLWVSNPPTDLSKSAGQGQGQGLYGNPSMMYTTPDGLLVPPPGGVQYGQGADRSLRHVESSSTVDIHVVPPSRPPSSLREYAFSPIHLSPNSQQNAPLPVPAPGSRDEGAGGYYSRPARGSPAPGTYVPVIPTGFNAHSTTAPRGGQYTPYVNPTMVPPPQNPPGWSDTRPNSPYSANANAGGGFPPGFVPQSVTPMPEPVVDGLPVNERKGKKKKGGTVYGNPTAAEQVSTMGPAAMQMPEPNARGGGGSSMGPASMAMPAVPIIPPPRNGTASSGGRGGFSMPEPTVPNIVPGTGSKTPRGLGGRSPLDGAGRVSTIGPAAMQMPEPTVGGGGDGETGSASPNAPFSMPEPTVPNIVSTGKKGKKNKAARGGGDAAGGGSTMSYNAGGGMPEPTIPNYGATSPMGGASPNRPPLSMPEATVTDYMGGSGVTKTPNPGRSPALPPSGLAGGSSYTPHLSTKAMPEPTVVDYIGGGAAGSGAGGQTVGMPEPNVLDYTGAAKGKKKGKLSKGGYGGSGAGGRTPVIPPPSVFNDDPDEEEEEAEVFIPPLSVSNSEAGDRGTGGGGGGAGGWNIGGWGNTITSGSGWGMPSVFGGSKSPQPVGAASLFGGASVSPAPGGPMSMPSPHVGGGAAPWDTQGGSMPVVPGGTSPSMGAYGNPTMPVIPVVPGGFNDGNDDEDDPAQDVDPQTAMNTAMNSSSVFLGVGSSALDGGKKKKKKTKPR